MVELEQEILSAIGFPKQSSTGFYQVKCAVCGDTRTRAGFKFEPDKVIYNCFRGKCDASCEYEYGGYLSRRFRKVVDAFGIQISPELRLKNKKPSLEETLNKALYEPHTYPDVDFPEDFVLYDPKVHITAQELLRSRGVSDQDYLIGKLGNWKNRLIVPFFHGKKLIGWQGILLSGSGPKFITSGSDLLYMPDGYVPKAPLVFEGVFDAKSLPGGIATLHSSVSKKQAFFLKDKDPILIPDRKDSRFLDVAKRYGWRVCVPDFKEKDVNDAVQKYGKLVAARMIHEGVTRNMYEAEVKYNLWKTKN